MNTSTPELLRTGWVGWPGVPLRDMGDGVIQCPQVFQCPRTGERHRLIDDAWEEVCP